jgi:hypothetical protein
VRGAPDWTGPTATRACAQATRERSRASIRWRNRYSTSAPTSPVWVRAARGGVSALHGLILQEPGHVGENLEGRLETRQGRPKADGSPRARRGGPQRPRTGEKPSRMLEQLVRPFGVGFTTLVPRIGASL